MPFLALRRCGAFACGLLLAAACGPEATDEGSLPQGPGTGPTACPATFGERLTLTAISDTRAATTLFAASLPDEGTLLAWPAMDGVHLTRTSARGDRAGKDLVVAGATPYGLAARDGAYGVLVSRGSDALYLVLLAPDGATLRDERLLGEVDHKVTNNQWFGTGIRAGRLLWTGAEWAAYFTVQRLWSDGVAHYGDTLRLHKPDGSPSKVSWDWGCSHSMEVRLAQRPGQLGALCSSDCYPKKGVLFNNKTLLYGDSASNCAGGYGTHLGGLVPLADGFWAAFTAKDQRAAADLALARIDVKGAAAPPLWLSEVSGDETQPRLIQYGDELLAAYRTADKRDLFQRARLDSGAAVGAAEALPGSDLTTASDLVRYPGGDVGWVQSSKTGLTLARLRTCR